ncbi:MAG TPA: methylated-DNA--[protein]-cysteine S-methyltransferase [Gemmataceae bacterium]|jgi:methylated-DNA-[protein]-cysteine S-methyltransferase|nr:methylated-DNA--[protein]-cysteine S-methyltransferase [Gemmataceae bacterium]
MRLSLDRWSSPVSTLLFVTDREGNLRALEFDDHEDRMHRLLSLHYGNYTFEEGKAPRAIRQSLAAYFDGKLDALDGIPVATGGTRFQCDVWNALRAIPSGTTTTYGQLAETIGRSGASRAVGAANGANPVAIVVPCHRVIGANGTLTGYASGLPRKRWLLDHEMRFAKPSRLPELSVS